MSLIFCYDAHHLLQTHYTSLYTHKTLYPKRRNRTASGTYFLSRRGTSDHSVGKPRLQSNPIPCPLVKRINACPMVGAQTVSPHMALTSWAICRTWSCSKISTKSFNGIPVIVRCVTVPCFNCSKMVNLSRCFNNIACSNPVFEIRMY